MRQNQHRRLRDIVGLDARTPTERRQGAGGLIHHQVSAQTRYTLRATQLADQDEQAFRHRHLGQELLGAQHLLPKGDLLGAPGAVEAVRIGLPGQAPLDYFRT